jgi:putative endonuclease
MVHWIYIIECNDNFIYVGETSNIYRRLKEHKRGKGGKNTHNHIPKKLIGLYKVNDNQSFYQYNSAINFGTQQNVQRVIDEWGQTGDNLFIENRITERLFYERKNNHEYGTGSEWYRIRGGKYTRDNLDDEMLWAKELCERPNRIPGTLRMVTPVDSMTEEEIVDRPLCICGMPCEVKLSKDKIKIYFVCALKNVCDNFIRVVDIGTPCNYFKLHTKLN